MLFPRRNAAAEPRSVRMSTRSCCRWPAAIPATTRSCRCFCRPVFLQTGIRVSELCALTREDIDFDARHVHVGNGKGQKARTIELEKRGIQAIKSYLAVRPESLHEEVFLNYQGEPLSERGVRKMFAKYLKASGITKKISPHTLRHAFATHKAERGVSPYVLREWLGHARLDTTQIYVHMARENTKKAMEATSL